MVMRRNIPWGLAALYPLVGLTYITIAQAADPQFVPFLIPRTPFWISYWWLVIGGSFFVQLLFFLVHALMNPALSVRRRSIWALAIFIIGFIAVPFYWLFQSEKTT